MIEEKCQHCGSTDLFWSVMHPGILRCESCHAFVRSTDSYQEESRSKSDPTLLIVALTVLIILLEIVIFVPKAHAEGLCVPMEGAKATTEKAHGQWVNVTPAEWQFLRGIYAMNPLTPPGLPYGDRAVLSIPPGGNADWALVFFIDGDQACTPMPVPKKLLDLLATVAAGRINHQGSPL